MTSAQPPAATPAATPTPTPRQPPWPDAALAVALPEGRFSKPERWAWARIARGLIADMARYPGEDSDESAAEWWVGVDYQEADAPDPQKPETFKDHHTLSELFLRTVIFHEPYASAPERPGVRVGHVRVVSEIDWSGRGTSGELWFFGCRFEGEILLQDLRVAGTLSLRRCRLAGGLNADGMKVAGDLFCRDGFSVNGDVRLLGAEIGGQASFSGAKLSSSLRADGMKLTGDFFCRDEFSAKGDVRLLGAEIGGDASFTGATLLDALRADRMNLAGSLFCNEAFSAQGEVRLLGAEIGGQASFTGATLNGALRADRMKLTGSLFCDDGFSAKGDVALLGAEIGGSVGFRGATLHGALKTDVMKLTGGLYLRGMKRLGSATISSTQIDGDLQFASSIIDGSINLTGTKVVGAVELAQMPESKPQWRPGAKLILRNVTAGALAGGIDAFRMAPPEGQDKAGKKQPFVPMDLCGLRYSRLGGLQSQPGGTLADADWRDLVTWLEAGIADDNGNAHASFTPGPFRTLARELTDSGHVDKANRVLYAMHQHERRSAGWFGGRKWMLFAADAMIGFGYKNHRAFAWFFAAVFACMTYGLFATGAAHFSPTAAGFERFWQWFWFAFGNGVPLIQLDEGHKTFLARALFPGKAPNALPDVPTWFGVPFYLAKIFGFIVLSYLAASLSGLATRERG